jgi:hypothetical protein
MSWKDLHYIFIHIRLIELCSDDMAVLEQCDYIRKKLEEIDNANNMDADTDFEYLEEYHEKGGTYVLPVDIVNDLTGRIEELVAEVKELNVSLTWWQNRYNANEKLLERYRTDENGSSKDTTGNNQEA